RPRCQGSDDHQLLPGGRPVHRGEPRIRAADRPRPPWQLGPVRGVGTWQDGPKGLPRYLAAAGGRPPGRLCRIDASSTPGRWNGLLPPRRLRGASTEMPRGSDGMEAMMTSPDDFPPSEDLASSNPLRSQEEYDEDELGEDVLDRGYSPA